MLPVLFNLFGHPVHAYGVTATLGFLAGYFFARREAARTGQDPEEAADFIFYSILFGLIGARILYMIVNRQYFAAHPSDIVRLDKGGLVFYGGPLFTAVPLWLIMRRRGVSVMAYSDICMPATILGLGVARLGCLAAGCCYGNPAQVPWAVHYPIGSNADMAYQGAALHPAPIYEMLACFLIVAGALWMNQRKKVHGETFFYTVTAYAAARSIIEFFRGDAPRGFVIPGILSTSQAISLVVGLAALSCWIYFRKKPTPTMRIKA